MTLLLIALALPSAPEPSLRALCIRADTVLLGSPIDPVIPVRFRVSLALRGKMVREIDTGLRDDDVKAFDEPDFEEKGKLRPRRNDQGLLFLKGGKLIGLRLVTDDGRVMGLDPNGKVALRTSRWPELVQRVRRDVATVDHLMRCKALPTPERKTAALVAWIDRNRAALSSPVPSEKDDEAPAGWEELSLGVFDWIFETNDPACAWRAIRLFASMNGGELLKPRVPVFAGEAGRAFLLGRARDKESLGGDRARAIKLLFPKDGRPDADLVDAVAALLEDEDPAVRLAAVVPLLRFGKARHAEKIEAAYGKATGPLRQELGWLLCAVAPARWKKLSGNPEGVAAALRDAERGGSEITFWLHLRSPGLKVHEPPTLVVERLGPVGMVTETKTSPLSVAFVPVDWKDGWAADGPLPAKLSLSGLQSGASYRFRVEGFVGSGKAKEKWKTEPLHFRGPFR